jgi:hypothetical protein
MKEIPSFGFPGKDADFDLKIRIAFPVGKME